MPAGRWELRSRGEPLLVAERDAVVSAERGALLAEGDARAELDWIPPEQWRELVRDLAWRFPGTRLPLLSARIRAELEQRIGSAAVVLRR